MNKIENFTTPAFRTWLDENGFFSAPASTKYHGSYVGGLYNHSLSVMIELCDLTEKNNLIWSRPESPEIVGMFHDLCKIDAYQHPIVAHTIEGNPCYNNTEWEHNNETLLKGHGDKSVMLLAAHMQLTEEEIMCIRYHMGAFSTNKEDWRDYTRAVNKYPNVLWTHTADMIASHVRGI